MSSTYSRLFMYAARWFCLLLLAAAGVLRAGEPQRWLLVFDTSSTMKKYLPATQTAVQQLLMKTATNQLQRDDSVGVWAYGKQINAEFKSYRWEPENAMPITTNLLAYLYQRRYSGDSRLSVLSPTLTRIAAGSERLTVIIFCDGQSQIDFTPYADGVNQSFTDGLSERKKSRQPFVLVLRCQQGKFVGCTVNYPPANLNLPDFPPLPVSPKTNAPPVPKPAPKVVVPPLVIVGEEVGTNLNAAPKPSPPPAVPVPVVPTNPPPPPPATNLAFVAKPPEPMPTNTVTAPVVTNESPWQVTNELSKTVVTQAILPVVSAPAVTNVTAPVTTENGDRQTGILIIIGVSLLLLAVILAGFLIRSGRRPHSSLITSSMQDQPPRK